MVSSSSSEIETVFDITEAIVNVTCFVIMFLLLIWCICKYRFDGQDKIFIYSLLMFLIAYMILMIGSLLFLITYNTISTIHLESFIQRYVFPFSYLVIWLIELMLLFEMQLMKVRIETIEAVLYYKKL